MKVAIVSPFFPQETGIAKYTAIFYTALKKIKFIEPTIVTEADYRSKDYNIISPSEFDSTDYDLIIMQWGNNTSHLFMYHTIHNKIPKKKTITILHENISGCPSLLSLCKISKKKFILEHPTTSLRLFVTNKLMGLNIIKRSQTFSYFFNQQFGCAVEKSIACFESDIIKKSKKIFVHSHYLKSLLAIKYSNIIEKNDIVCIKHGANLSEFDKIASENYLTKLYKIKRNFIILYFGFLIPHKKLDLVLNALCLLKTIYGIKQFKFFIVGGIKSEEYHRQLKELTISLGLRENVYFIGPILEEEIPLYFKISDVVVNLKRMTIGEISGPLIWALASGRPVITMNVGSYKEYVIHEKTGFLISPNDEVALARYLLKLIKNKNLKKQMGYEAQKYAQKYLDINKVVKTVLEEVKNETRNML